MKLITTFFVPGKPATAGSKTAFRTPQGRMIVTPASKFTKPWMAQVRAVASEAYRGEVVGCPIHLGILFRLNRPKGHYKSDGRTLSKKGREAVFQISTPDLTKLLRAIEDSLKGIVWRDDSQVVSQVTQKVYVHAWDRPGAMVIIFEMEPEDAEEASTRITENDLCGHPPGDRADREEAGGGEGEGVESLYPA